MSTPEALYRNAIDLNRYSNSVARRVINAYNDIIIDAANQLRTIDELAAPVKAARLIGRINNDVVICIDHPPSYRVAVAV